MRLHSLEHESFEGLGNIEVWAKNRGHIITRTLLFNNEKLPETSEFDWLVIEQIQGDWLVPSIFNQRSKRLFDIQHPSRHIYCISLAW